MTMDVNSLTSERDALQEMVIEQKAEIERLTPKCEDCAGCSEWKCDCSNIKTEAIEEVISKLEKKMQWQPYGDWRLIRGLLVNIKKEMTE